MRNHIRREAGQYIQAAGWLVPVAFAIAAIAAVAIGGSEEDVQWNASLPAAMAWPALPAPAAFPAPAVESVEATEHVQAF